MCTTTSSTLCQESASTRAGRVLLCVQCMFMCVFVCVCVCVAVGAALDKYHWVKFPFDGACLCNVRRGTGNVKIDTLCAPLRFQE